MYDISHIPGGTKIAKSSNICKHKGDAKEQPTGVQICT